MRPSAFLVAMAILIPVAIAATPPKVVNDGYGDLVYVPAGAFKMGDNFGGSGPTLMKSGIGVSENWCVST